MSLERLHSVSGKQSQQMHDATRASKAALDQALHIWPLSLPAQQDVGFTKLVQGGLVHLVERHALRIGMMPLARGGSGGSKVRECVAGRTSVCVLFRPSHIIMAGAFHTVTKMHAYWTMVSAKPEPW